MSNTIYPFTGRKKTSVSRVWYKFPIKRQFTVNDETFDNFFVKTALNPADYSYTVRGGGIKSRVHAIISGILKASISNKLITKKQAEESGYLVYDFRSVEMKKAGKIKARKSPPYKRR